MSPRYDRQCEFIKEENYAHVCLKVEQLRFTRLTMVEGDELTVFQMRW